MKCASLQLIFRIANYRECTAKIKRLMAALTARCVERHGNTLFFAKSLYLADKFVPSHCSLSDENDRLRNRLFFMSQNGWQVRCGVHRATTSVSRSPVPHLPALFCAACSRVFRSTGAHRRGRLLRYARCRLDCSTGKALHGKTAARGAGGYPP